MRCIGCSGGAFTKAGRGRADRQMYRCSGCGRRRSDRSDSAFKGYRFPDEVIALAVRWYLRYRLTYADVAELLAERGIQVDPSTIYDWVQTFAPQFIRKAHHVRTPLGRRWRVDETYVRVCGRWMYLFRALDEHGQVIDVWLSLTRDREAAEDFFNWIRHITNSAPHRVITDKAACYPEPIRSIYPDAKHLTRRYLNNRLERDHGHLKQRIRPMRGFKHPRSASIFCAGHALMRNLGGGHSLLARGTSRHARLVSAWTALTAAL